tara:strand:- start:87 stop:269 length:183 start_codon:yes stop_codon:yes gene_type:complete
MKEPWAGLTMLLLRLEMLQAKLEQVVRLRHSKRRHKHNLLLLVQEVLLVRQLELYNKPER